MARLIRPGRRPCRRGWQGYPCNACGVTFKTAAAYRQHHCR